MQIEQITEQTATNTLVLYPGRFHPFHKGHKAVYDHLVNKYGINNVYIVTSDKVDPPKSPFNFQEKQTIMRHVGVPTSRVKQVKNPYRAEEVVSKVDADNTAVIFAVSEKDMAEDPRFSFKPKKDGSAGYFAPLPKNGDLESLSKRGYIEAVPTFKFDLIGQPMKSASEVRAQFASSDTKQQALIVKDLFGSYSEKIHQLMLDKIKPVSEDVQPARPDELGNYRSDPTPPKSRAKRFYTGADGVLAKQIARATKMLADFRDIDNKGTASDEMKMKLITMVRLMLKKVQNIRAESFTSDEIAVMEAGESVEAFREAWSQKYKNSIDCSNPKGFSQRAHCAGKAKK